MVTFNVHYADDLPALVRSIQRNPALCAADVFLLQETESYKSEGASRTHKLARALKLNYVYAPARYIEEGGTHGLAILSRYPLSDITVIPLKQFDLNLNTRRRIAVAATVTVGSRSLRFYNLHLDTRVNLEDRLEQLRPVVRAAVEQAIPHVILGGDFNTNPFRWLFHVIPVFYSDQADTVDEFMRKNGFATPFAEAGPTNRRPMFRFRVDSIYSRGVTVEGFGIERSVEVSDHFPLWLDVGWSESDSAPR
ncbi:MAG: hypothetical protein GWN58_39900 [Anaerolineae bacterium]|nr:hypothetical protein [Anaerolineae bacterium]